MTLLLKLPRRPAPTTLEELSELVARGDAAGPFEGGGAIERSPAYRMLMSGFREGRRAVPGHPEDAMLFRTGSDGTACFWFLVGERRRCVVRRCMISKEWFVVRVSDIHHTRVTSKLRRRAGTLRPSTWTPVAPLGDERAGHAAGLTAPSPPEDAARKAQRLAGAIARARARLHARYRVVIDHERKQGSEGLAGLAARLGVSEPTLAVIRHRARKSLVKLIREEMRAAVSGARPDGSALPRPVRSAVPALEAQLGRTGSKLRQALSEWLDDALQARSAVPSIISVAPDGSVRAWDVKVRGEGLGTRPDSVPASPPPPLPDGAAGELPSQVGLPAGAAAALSNAGSALSLLRTAWGDARPAAITSPIPEEPLAPASLRLRAPGKTLLVAGFDSAWTAAGRGALTILRTGPAGTQVLAPPTSVTFDEALHLLVGHANGPREHAQVVIAINQPLVVPNATGRRPVDAVASRVAQRVGSATQPANRSRVGMFDDAAPLWAFLGELRKRWPDLSLDPADVRDGGPAAVVVEAYPVLGLLGLLPGLLERGKLFRYNPTRTSFEPGDWASLCASLARMFARASIPPLSAWCGSLAFLAGPTKRDQDRLDSVICAAMGLLLCSGVPMGVVGDLERGYMLFPAIEPLRSTLQDTARAEGVDARVLPGTTP